MPPLNELPNPRMKRPAMYTEIHIRVSLSALEPFPWQGAFLTPVAVRKGADEGPDCFDDTANYNGRLPPVVVREERPR